MKFFLIYRNSGWRGCKVIYMYEEWLPNIWGNAKIFSHI